MLEDEVRLLWIAVLEDRLVTSHVACRMESPWLETSTGSCISVAAAGRVNLF